MPNFIPISAGQPKTKFCPISEYKHLRDCIRWTIYTKFSWFLGSFMLG